MTTTPAGFQSPEMALAAMQTFAAFAGAQAAGMKTMKARQATSHTLAETQQTDANTQAEMVKQAGQMLQQMVLL